MHWEKKFAETARQQAGAIGIDQLKSIGCTGDHWARARLNGRWVALTRRVLVADAAAVTDDQRVWAALLDAGGDPCLHGPSTLSWAGLRGYDLSTIHVTRGRSKRNSPSTLATVHQLRDVRDCDRCVIRGVPSVTVLRAVWTEASRFSYTGLEEIGVRRVGRLLDDAHRLGLVTWSDLHRSICDLQRRGRAGTALMRHLADDRPIGSSPTESRNEDQFESVMERWHMRPLKRQIVVGGDQPIGRCDFRDPELPMIAEVNSMTFHTTPTDRRLDERRYAAMIDAGYSVAVIWDIDVWSRPYNVAQTIRRTQSLAARGAHAVVHTAGCPWPTDPERLIIADDRPKLRG